MICRLTIVRLLLAIGVHGAERSTIESHADKLASLIGPAKLATPGKRGANSRVPKAVAILAVAESEKLAVAQSLFLPAALILAQRAFAIAVSLARPAALIVTFLAGALAATVLALAGLAPALTFAQ